MVAIASASPYAEPRRSYVDLERGFSYRKPIGKRATKKRQTPPAVAISLAALEGPQTDRHMLLLNSTASRPRRKKGVENGHGASWAGGQSHPPPLRHTAATWLMQRGAPIWEAAGFLRMSPEVLQSTYGHHHPDYLHGAAAAIGKKGRYVSVVGSGTTSDQKKKT